MRGHVRKRGSTYSIVFDLGRDPTTGKRKQKWISGFKTKKEAEKALSDIIAKLTQGDFAEPSKQILTEYMQYWLEVYAKPNVSPKTYKRYADIIRLYISPTIGQLRLDKLRPLHIQDLYNKAIKDKTDGGFGLSPASALYIHRVLHQALKHAVKWQMLIRNPADAVEPPKTTKPQMHVLTEKDIEAVLNELVNDAIFMPTYLAIMTGMRRGEICGLKWSDIDFDKGVMYIQRSLQRINGILQEKQTKTSQSSRSVALSTETINLLKKHKAKQAQEKLMMGQLYQDNNYVCAWPDGRPMDPDYLTHRFAKVVSKLGLQARFHDLRHTHATLLLKEGIHPKIVSERLGHSEIRITLDTYSHVLPQMQREAAEKLDKIIAKK